jgi:hypothetical protein
MEPNKATPTLYCSTDCGAHRLSLLGWAQWWAMSRTSRRVTSGYVLVTSMKFECKVDLITWSYLSLVLEMSTDGRSGRVSIRHPIFWFDDGSIIVRVQDHLFKVHRSLLSRHSSLFAHFPRIMRTSTDLREDLAVDCDYDVIDLDRHVLTQDVEVLLEHLYHDVWVTNG